MALVVETGAGVSGANTFVTRAAAIAYGADRAIDLLDDETTDAMLFRAGIYLRLQTWKGNPAGTQQSMPWPRNNVYLPKSNQNQLFPYYGGQGYLLNDAYGMPDYGFGNYAAPYPGQDADLFPNNQVPAQVALAQMELVLAQKAGINIIPTTGNTPFVIEKTVGPLTTKYSDKYGPVIGPPIMPIIDAMLSLWVDDEGGTFGLSSRRV